jgi:uncharacterized protein YggE
MNTVQYKKMVIGLVLILGSLALAACAGAEAESPEVRTLVVAGVAEAKGTPDTATVQLGVSVSDENLAAAIDEANRTMQEVTEALIARGVRKEDIQTSFYNVWRQEIFDPQTGMPTEEVNHHVETSMAVTVRNIGELSGMIDAGLAAGANNINGISFQISDTSMLETQARTMAIEDANDRAREIAMTMGLNLGQILSISEGGASVPGPYGYGFRGEGMGGGAPASISPGQSTVSSQVNVMYEVLP